MLLDNKFNLSKMLKTSKKYFNLIINFNFN